MHVDEHHDDCRRASYKRRKDTDGVARLEFIRSFDTCHLDDYKEEDYLIEDGTVHVVYASGSGPLYRLAFVDFSTMAGIILLLKNRINGVSPTTEDVGFQRTRLLKPPVTQHKHPKMNDPPRPLLIANVQLNVPAQETTYYCRVVRLPEHFSRKHHVIQVIFI
jgi:dopamine beta-monooxygenase